MMMVDENVFVDTGFDSGSSAPSDSSVSSPSAPPVESSSPPPSDSGSVSPPEPVVPSAPPAVGGLPVDSGSDTDLGEILDEGPGVDVDSGNLTDDESAAVPDLGGDSGDLTEEPPSVDLDSGSDLPHGYWSNLPSTLLVPDVSNELELTGVETFQLSPITGANSSGLKKVLLDVIGPYDNIVTQYRYQQNTSTNYTYINEVTPDYPWIASATLFIVLVWSLFRLVGRSITWMK